MIALALCIVVGTLHAAVPAGRFTLAWRHTVEKVLWEEDYVVAGDWLLATGARIRGSGAGMEPPPGAVLRKGIWHFRPAQRWHREIVLARSTIGDDYSICIDRGCRPLAEFAPPGAEPTVLRPCRPDRPPQR